MISGKSTLDYVMQKQSREIDGCLIQTYKETKSGKAMMLVLIPVKSMLEQLEKVQLEMR